MRFLARWLVLLALPLSLSCQPAEHPATPSVPATAPSGQAPDLAPNANAARYGPHGVAETPPAGAAVPTRPEPQPAEANPAAGAGPGDSMAEMRGHPCQCGKSCHCGHCSGAVPGCHCHVKRADEKAAE